MDPRLYNIESLTQVNWRDLPEIVEPLTRDYGEDEPGREFQSFKEFVDGDIHDRIVKLKTSITSKIEKRDDAVKACIASIMCGVPLVLFGPPGTAKSMIVRLLAESCKPPGTKLSVIENDQDENEDYRRTTPYFEYLMTSHTMPEELFGPPNIKALTEDNKFVRDSVGMLPEAEFAFLDELFRASGHILNTLLSVINERKFHDGATVRDVPLLGVITAANFPPQDPQVQAVYDRFPVRVFLKSVLDDEAYVKNDEKQDRARSLLNKTLKGEQKNLELQGSSNEEQIICTNHFRLIRARFASEQLRPDPGNIRLNEFITLFLTLRDTHKLSDRAFGMLWRFGLALDWIDNPKTINGYVGTDKPDKQACGHIKVFNWIAQEESLVGSARSAVDEALRGERFTNNDS